jgi:hypothetical protein
MSSNVEKEHLPIISLFMTEVREYNLKSIAIGTTSIFTLHSDIPTTEVSIPVGKFWVDITLCVFWYVDVKQVHRHPNLHLKYLIVVPFTWYSLSLSFFVVPIPYPVSWVRPPPQRSFQFPSCGREPMPKIDP